MRRPFRLFSAPLALSLAGLVAAVSGEARADTPLPACAADGSTLGVSRIVEIDTSTGALFGAISTQAREARFLGPKEIVLTFDDGPMPPVTRAILDTLDTFCTRATFFSVGRMALAYPATVRNVMDRGHTLGTHTFTHPLNLKRLALEKSKDEIERGHAAVTLAAGKPIAPFFRFPGLSDSGPMLKHLQGRGIAAFTVDVVSNDSYIADADRLIERTLREVEDHKGGILLFHDIKPATARALPRLLAELYRRGYKVVHMRAKGSVAPSPELTAKLTPLLKPVTEGKSATLVPFYGTAMRQAAADADLPVTAIAPAARARTETAAPQRTAAVKHAAIRGSRHPATAVRGWYAETVAEPRSR